MPFVADDPSRVAPDVPEERSSPLLLVPAEAATSASSRDMGIVVHPSLGRPDGVAVRSGRVPEGPRLPLRT